LQNSSSFSPPTSWHHPSCDDLYMLALIVVQCVRKVAVHLGYGPCIWLSVPKLPLQCAAVWL
jgi:hypothetical protein